MVQGPTRSINNQLKESTVNEQLSRLILDDNYMLGHLQTVQTLDS